MSDFGPFSVRPEQIASLGGASFAKFINRLLATETAACGMSGITLETTYRENIGDGGVDARLRNSSTTPWIPSGDSAWQFKAGDLAPNKCIEELGGAKFAQEILRAGGSYRLVLGASLTSAKIARRREALAKTVRELGIDAAADAIEVIAADSLARWVERYPALAVNPLLGGVGPVGQTFDGWSSSNRHMTAWVSSQERDAQIEALRKTISSNAQSDLHLIGLSGLGKTRLAMEALRGQPYEAIVVYFPDADAFSAPVLAQLHAQGRTAVIVIDECSCKKHETYASMLPSTSPIRLMTIGEPEDSSTRTPMVRLSAMNDEAMNKLLQANKPQLWPEAERVVVDVASGNIDYALKLAQALLRHERASAKNLITGEDLRAFFNAQLPDGRLFSASCVLALFTRFGYDGEVANELNKIASGLQLSVEDLRDAAAALNRRSMISKQGRYRSVCPHPLAVHLAIQGWSEFGERIATDLLPNLNSNLAERLFRRAADIGELDSSSPALSAILAGDGPLASFDSLNRGNNSALLVHFAVLAPAAVTSRLARLISTASDEELKRQCGIRRDLVWTLEKLVWHSGTFTVAADALLRLALAETESCSNNATGTWVELFGATLPKTAASPDSRIAYLQDCANSSDSRVKLLLSQAAGRALEDSESVMVSGEVQGGVVVEPRGTTSTWGELFAYRNAAIDILGRLAIDEDVEVAKVAQKQLVGKIHGSLRITPVRDHLGSVVAGLPDEMRENARIEINRLRLLFVGADIEDGRSDALEKFEALLPEETPNERLAVLANEVAWGDSINDLVGELATAAKQIDGSNPAGVLIGLLLSGEQIPAAYAIGRSLRTFGVNFDEGAGWLLPVMETSNSEAVVGFLRALVDEGESDAFDRFFERSTLPAPIALQLSIQGPPTKAAISRVNHLISRVAVAEAARMLFSWTHNLDETNASRILEDLSQRVAGQADYNAVVEFASMQVFQKSCKKFEQLDPLIAELVLRRTEFPNVDQQEWDWSQLARRQLTGNPAGLANLLADFIELGAISSYFNPNSEDVLLLKDAVREGGEVVWLNLMERLSCGARRLSSAVHGWFPEMAAIETIEQWVGDSVDRARTLAGVTNAGDRLSATARFLIDHFGQDKQVASNLASSFLFGSWWGNESDHITGQIERLKSWAAEPGQSKAVKDWTQNYIIKLEERRQQAVAEEEEDCW